MQDTKSVALRLEAVTVRFGQTEALRSISLQIPNRSVVALVGPSGAGKTTLLRVCGAAIVPTTGRAEIGGMDLEKSSLASIRALRTKIGFIHQRLELIPNVRVLQNVLYGRFGSWGFLRSLRNFLFASRATTEEVFHLLERLGIGEKLYSRTDRLSGGQMQRVAIARALFQNPEIVLADEPISSVDPARARATVALLTELAAEHQTTLIVSLHNFELAAEFFPRLVGISKGEILFDASPEEVTEDMRAKLYTLEKNDLLA